MGTEGTGELGNGEWGDGEWGTENGGMVGRGGEGGNGRRGEGTGEVCPILRLSQSPFWNTDFSSLLRAFFTDLYCGRGLAVV